jgi:uncharacterized membrane protein
MRYEATQEIDAGLDHVWKVLDDVENWPRWTSTMRRVRRLDTGDFGVGSRCRIEQPRLPAAVWEVTDHRPQRTWTWQTRTPGLTTRAEHHLTPLPNGGVRLVQVIVQTGPLEPVARLLYGGLVRRYIDTEGEGLRRYCEGR